MSILRIAMVGAILAQGQLVLIGASPDDLRMSIAIICAVGPEGRGNAEASVAWRRLAIADIKSVPQILAAMDNANELAANWLRAAVDTIVSRDLASGSLLPARELRAFLADTRHHARARRLAFELIQRDDPKHAELLLAGMLNDPSLELRRDAVHQILDAAKSSQAAGNKPKATAEFQRALFHARDIDQIEGTTKSLAELGVKVDLPKLFGWVMQWSVIGPFDSTGGKGFQAQYPPESSFDPNGEYDGKSGKVKWSKLVTTNDYGIVDLNKPLGKLKGVAGYARAEFGSEQSRPIELRLGTENSWKVWLNGKLLFERDEYHRAAEIDQYRMRGRLEKGVNVILVKLCQNEQTEDWAEAWQFQLRVTDELGTPVAPAPNNSRETADTSPPKGAL